jgi:hypothetical protein
MNETKRGICDAQTFTAERPKEAARFLEGNRTSPDVELICALGCEGVAKLFGVDPGSQAYDDALDVYNEAFLTEIRRIHAQLGR